MDLAGLKSTELASAFFSCASVLQTWYAALALSIDDQRFDVKNRQAIYEIL